MQLTAGMGHWSFTTITFAKHHRSTCWLHSTQGAEFDASRGLHREYSNAISAPPTCDSTRREVTESSSVEIHELRFAELEPGSQVKRLEINNVVIVARRLIDCTGYPKALCECQIQQAVLTPLLLMVAGRAFAENRCPKSVLDSRHPFYSYICAWRCTSPAFCIARMQISALFSYPHILSGAIYRAALTNGQKPDPLMSLHWVN